MIKSLQSMLIYNIFIHRHVFVLWLVFLQGGGGGGGGCQVEARLFFLQGGLT